MCLLMNMQTQHKECSEHHNVFYTAGILTPVFWGFFKWLSLQSQLKWINLYSMQHPRNHFGGLKFLKNAMSALKICSAPALPARSLLQRRYNELEWCLITRDWDIRHPPTFLHENLCRTETIKVSPYSTFKLLVMWVLFLTTPPSFPGVSY